LEKACGKKPKYSRQNSLNSGKNKEKHYDIYSPNVIDPLGIPEDIV
jgi:hypothetical protein